MPRHRLRLALIGSEPAIWREFEIDGRLPLRMLHLAIQVIMGWREAHLHQFIDADPLERMPPTARRWAPAGFENAEGTLDEGDFSVDDVLDGRPTLWYEYDFGDGWTHRIDAIDRRDDEHHLAPVVLLDGGNRGPYEDSGGPHGYAEKLAILADPAHPEHHDIADWARVTVGPWAPLDPASFDPVGVQSELNLLFNPAGSGISPYDMSGLVKIEEIRHPRDLAEDSPLVNIASVLPPPIRSELRQHLGRTGALGPVDIDEASIADVIRPFIWLMGAVGTGGMVLTSAGRLPPATVLTGMTELGWIDGWIGKGNREDLTPPIATLRESAQRMGLVRKQKDRLVLSAAAKKASTDPHLQFRLVARGFYRGLSDAETDAAVLLLLSIADGTAPAERWKTIAFGLEMCGWRSASGRDFTREDIDHATHHAQQVLRMVGDASARSARADNLRTFARETLR